MDSINSQTALQHEEPDLHPALAPFVARRMRTWSEAPIPFEMRLPPSGSMFLTLVFGDPMTLEFKPGEPASAPRLFIGGQLRNTMPVSRVQGRVGITGAEFTPTGFHRLFHRDCRRYTDDATPIEAVVPQAAHALLADIDSTPQPREKMALLQDFLVERTPHARPPSVVDKAVSIIEGCDGCVAVAEVARECNLSDRQLNRRFLAEVGIGPKHFAKVIQIKRALATLEGGLVGELQDLAQRTGYFDQAHFINDFQRLIGTNPLSFLKSGHAFLRTYMKHRA